MKDTIITPENITYRALILFRANLAPANDAKSRKTLALLNALIAAAAEAVEETRK